MVESLQLTTQAINVPSGDFGGDEPPYFWKVMRPFKWIGASAIVAVLFFSLAQLAPNVIFGQITEVVNDNSKNTADADLLALAVILIGFVGATSSYFFRVRAAKFTQSLVAYLRRRVFFRLSTLGVDYYDRELPGQVSARVAFDLDRILQFLERTGLLLLSQSAIFVVGMFVIVAIAPAAFPLIAALVVLVIIVALIQLPIGNQAFKWARAELGNVTAKFEEDFVARHEIRNLGAADLQTKKYVDACWQRRRSRAYALSVQAVGSQLLIFIGAVSQALILWKCGALTLDGTLTIGTTLSVYLLVQTATRPLYTIGPFYTQLLEVRVSWAQLREPFYEPILPVVSPTAVACPELQGLVTFDQVAFNYPQVNRPVLHDVSFTIPAGTVSALVGYTGAGKSSIAKLLSRTYDPTGGTVSIDGIDLRDMILSTYVPRLGVVPQDAFAFRGTVASNISYTVPDAPREDIEQAARDVGAYDLLSMLPDGFDSRVEEEGKNLTAAQRQLIALARAWMTRPDVMVLDEATSLLDADVEQKVLDAVHALGCTTLMITHRENVAKAADSVVVLDAGRVRRRRPGLRGVAARQPVRPPLERAGGRHGRAGRRRPRRAPAISTASLFDLTGRVAIVTGGTRGIGRAIAEGFADAGASVVVASRKPEACAETEAALTAAGHAAIGVPTHMGDLDAIDQLVTRAVDRFGAIDIVVNNAALGLSLPLGELTPDAWQKVFDVNVRGPVFLAQAALPHLRASAHAAIVNVLSAGVFMALPDNSVYGASKSALLSFTRSMAAKWAPDGIRVNGLIPGSTDTDMLRGADTRAPGGARGRQHARPCRAAGRDDRARGLSRVRRVELYDRPGAHGRRRPRSALTYEPIPLPELAKHKGSRLHAL